MIKINAGSGRKNFHGYVNVDVQATPGYPAPDVLADLRKIPLDSGCASELVAIHVFEHFYRWECDDLLDEWRRLLAPSGRLILEMPDVVKCAHNLINSFKGREKNHPDQLSYWGLYGDPRYNDPFMCHRWGWTFATLKPLLEEHGFGEIEEKETLFHSNGRGIRDFRVEARKK